MKILPLAAALITSLILGTNTYAACAAGGIPGTSSSCTMDVSVDVDNLVQITGVKDINVFNWTGQDIDYNNTSYSQDLCIFSNVSKTGSENSYNIKFTDSTSGTDLALKGAGAAEGSSIPYTLLFTDKNKGANTIKTNNQVVAVVSLLGLRYQYRYR